MLSWLVISISVIMPMILLPLLLPTLVYMAQRKNITDAPNFRKLQRRPVSLMGGTLVVAVCCASLAVANLYVDLNNLFPAMCMIVFLMTIGLIDDSIDLGYKYKLLIQLFVVTVLCSAGNYRISSLWNLFGIEYLPLGVSYALSIFVGVAIINAINFADGIDGLAAVFGIFSGISMSVWCWHHEEVAHAILALIISSSLFAFWIFNGFSEKFKIYLGDSGSLVLGLFTYLSVCRVLSHHDMQPHLSNGYELSFVIALLAPPMFDFVRVVLGRIFHRQSPVKPDRTHLHHILVDLGLTHQSTNLIIVILHILTFCCWGIFVEMRISPSWVVVLMLLAGCLFINMPYVALSIFRKQYPAQFRRLSAGIKNHSRKLIRGRAKITRLVDKLPTILR